MKIFETLKLEKEKAMITKESRIILQETGLMDDERKKWFFNKFSPFRDYERNRSVDRRIILK